MSKFSSFMKDDYQGLDLSKSNIKYETREVEKSDKIKNMDSLIEQLQQDRNQQYEEFKNEDSNRKGSSNPNDFIQIMNDEENKEKIQTDDDVILMLQQLGILY